MTDSGKDFIGREISEEEVATKLGFVSVDAMRAARIVDRLSDKEKLNRLIHEVCNLSALLKLPYQVLECDNNCEKTQFELRCAKCGGSIKTWPFEVVR